MRAGYAARAARSIPAAAAAAPGIWSRLLRITPRAATENRIFLSPPPPPARASPPRAFPSCYFLGTQIGFYENRRAERGSRPCRPCLPGSSVTWFFMRARHGGWAAGSRRSPADFCSRAPPLPPVPLAGGCRPSGLGGCPAPPLSRRPRPQHGAALRGAPVSPPRTLSTGLPCPGGCLQTPGSARGLPGQPDARPRGKGLAPGRRVFPASVPSLFPTANPSAFLLCPKLRETPQPQTQRNPTATTQRNPTATRARPRDVPDFTPGVSPQGLRGTWLSPDEASLRKHTPLWKGSTGSSQIQPPILLVLPYCYQLSCNVQKSIIIVIYYTEVYYLEEQNQEGT